MGGFNQYLHTIGCIDIIQYLAPVGGAGLIQCLYECTYPIIMWLVRCRWAGLIQYLNAVGWLDLIQYLYAVGGLVLFRT